MASYKPVGVNENSLLPPRVMGALDERYIKPPPGMERYVVEGPGIDPSGATNSQPAIQAFINNLNTRSKADLDKGQVSAVFPPGLYRMDDTLTVDLFKVGLIAPYLGVTLDFRNIGAKVAVHLWSSTQTNASGFVGGRTPSAMTSMYGIQIQGPKGSGSDPTPPAGSVGVWIHGTSNGTTGNHKMESCTVRGFNQGILLGDHAYCLTFDQFLVHRCGTGFDITPGLDDSGERLNITNTTVYGCNLAIRNSDDCRWHITNSSFDYNKKVYEQGSNGVGFFRDCHFEQYMYRSDISSEWFSTSGGSLIIDGGIIACASANPNGSAVTFPPFLVRNDSDPESSNEVSVKGARITSGVRFNSDFLSGGTGHTEFDLVYTGTAGGAGQTRPLGSRAANLIADFGGNNSTLVDEWFVGEGTAGPSGAKTWNGNRSFYITSPRGNWVHVAAPIDAGRTYGARTRVAYATAPSEGIAIRFLWAKVVDGKLTKSQTIVERSYAVSSLTNNFDTSVMPNAGTTPNKPPSWATHMAIGYYSPGGGIYTTELLITPR